VIAFVGDVHDLLDPFREILHRVPPQVRTIIQVGDLWIWPNEEDVPPLADGAAREVPRRPRDTSMHWRRPPRDLYFLDGNHHPYWLTRGLDRPTRVAPGITYLPRGTVLIAEGRDRPLRIGILGGADSVIDAMFRRPGDDWWPNEERIVLADVDCLLANAKQVGGLDVFVTHTPPSSVTTTMTNGARPHPSSVLVEAAWRELGGGLDSPPLELICGHMHESWRDPARRVEVLPMLGVTIR